MKSLKLGLALGLVVVLTAAFALPGCAPEEVTPTIEKIVGAPVAESCAVVDMDYGGASDRIFQQGEKCPVQTIGAIRKYHVGTLSTWLVRSILKRNESLELEKQRICQNATMNLAGVECGQWLDAELVIPRT